MNGRTIHWVEDVIYLGQIISFTDTIEKEVNHRIALGWKKFLALQKIFRRNIDRTKKSTDL